MKYEITDFYGRTLPVVPRLGLYAVKDFIGTELLALAVVLDDVTDPTMPEQYCVLTVSFGEFIGMKNCAYIDTNNCEFAEQLREQGMATDTGFYKCSGFCQYPLWEFDEATLRGIDNETYQKYSDAFETYMASMYEDEPDEDSSPNMTM